MNKTSCRSIIIAAGVIVFFSSLSIANADIRRISVSTSNAQGNAQSRAPYFLSDNNQFVSFSSDASNLVSADSNGMGDAFLLNEATGNVVRYSISPSSGQGNGYSYAGPVSNDGRHVAFTFQGSNLISNDTNGLSDVYVKDILTGALERVSTNTSGEQLGEQSFVESMSDDGRYILMRIGQHQFVKDTLSGPLTQVDLKPNGASTIYTADAAFMSPDGRYVVFNSQGPDLVPGDSNGLNYDIFLRDLVTGSTTIESRSSSGLQGNGPDSYHPMIRGGRYIVFSSNSTNLVSGDTSGNHDVFLRDIQSGTTQRASVTSSGAEASGDSYTPDVSADGRFVVFYSTASNLVANDTNGRWDVFVHDMQTGVTAPVSVSSNGDYGNGDSYYPNISNDGSRIIFHSDASNLVSSDTNNTLDVFSVDNPLFNTNDAPTLDTIGNKSIQEGQSLAFAVTATDSDAGDFVSISSINLPSGALFDPQTGAFNWTPEYDQAGSYDVTFTATDSGDPVLSDSETVTIVVANTNRAPVLAAVGDKVANEGVQLTFTISATDPDGDSLIYAATNLPAGASFDPQTATFSWTPTFAQAGNYENIEFTVTDSGSPMELDVELITITVGDINRAPIVAAVAPQEIAEGVALSFTVAAVDPDSDSFVLSAANLPIGSSFDPQTGAFNWTPTLAQSGTYVVTFTATDTGSPSLTGATDVTIIVGDVPTPVEQAETIIDTVVNYDLPTGTENAYMANLKKIVKFIVDGKMGPAINQLNAFKTKVQADYVNGILTVAQRDELVGLADALLADLQ